MTEAIKRPDVRTYSEYSKSDDYLPYIWDGELVRSLKITEKFPLGQQLRDLIIGKFYLKVKFSNINSNIYLNGRPIINKRNKAQYPVFANGCKLLEGKPNKWGGSNKYPHPTFENGYCVVEIVCNGYPVFSKFEHEYHIEVIEFYKIETP